ncbi:Major facilitator superfamily domain general substrate transporter [Penicillium fimorum]|uniref:Major facilitator superfamily domain general substrate transporter n=1 Tax=Penicillium fimorum TaxID=1882269 RepID=A0A9X0C2A8_9EURO|nr:Major facilitator superfamily domain general substrate transporter [Penicillium fimorum]
MTVENPAMGPASETMKEPVTQSEGFDMAEASSGTFYSRVSGWYAKPLFQLVMVALICFLCPGMFNALSGMGGGGMTDATLVDKMNTALYVTSAFTSFFSGTIVNRLGVRITLACGGIGYCIYVASLLASLHKHVAGFNIFAGFLLGVCSSLLWTAQGTIMVSYPLEHQKGRFFTLFWSIFNVGSCVGSLIVLANSINEKTNVNVPDSTYIVFVVLTFLGSMIGLFIADAKKVVRSDGSKVVLMKNPSWKSELIGLWMTLRSEPSVLLLFPMFWSSNWFISYQTNSVNSAYFNTRTKALNTFLYYIAHILGACFISTMDLNYFRRTLRARGMLVILFTLTMVIHGGGYVFQKQYTRPPGGVKPSINTDWTDSNYGGPMFLYFSYGFYDVVWQGAVYWYVIVLFICISIPSKLANLTRENNYFRYIGTISNSGRKSANYVGFYKGIQSAGAGVMWAWDSTHPAYMSEFASNWGLLAGSVICAAPFIWLKIKDHVDVEEDLVGTDEKLEDVKPVDTEMRERVA